MKSISRLLFSIIFFTGAGIATSRSIAQKKQSPPNVIFILADDMGYGDIKKLNASAQVNTPNLDRLADEGAAFLNAHSNSAVCTPTRYGILTGRYAFRSSLKKGVLNGYSPMLIEADRFTVADLAKAAGYQTAVIGKWHLGLDWAKIDATQPVAGSDSSKPLNVDFSKKINAGPNQLGFDYSYILPASLDMPPYAYIENGAATNLPMIPFKGNNNPRGVFWRKGVSSTGFVIENTLDVFIDKARHYIANANEDKSRPFFLYLPLTSPHTPWLPFQQFKNSGAGTYGDFVQHTDFAVGTILQCLDSLGLAKNTIVIYTSDNGADWKPADEKNYPLHHANYIFRGEKSDIWEGGHHIPLLVRWPGIIKPGSRIAPIACLTDFMATLAAVTGQQLPANAGPDSFDLLPLLKGNTKPVRGSIIHHSIEGMFAIRQGKWKFVDGQGSGGWSMRKGNPGDPAGQLYDMENDERETTNLYDQYPEVVKELKALLEKEKQKK